MSNIRKTKPATPQTARSLPEIPAIPKIIRVRTSLEEPGTPGRDENIEPQDKNERHPWYHPDCLSQLLLHTT